MIWYPKAENESVVEWYRRATDQHKFRNAYRMIVEHMQTGLIALHAYAVRTGVER